MIMQYIKINILDESLRKFSRCSFNMSFLINVISLYLWNHDHIIWGYGTNNSKSIAYFLLDQFLHADSYMWFHQESSCEVVLCFKIQVKHFYRNFSFWSYLPANCAWQWCHLFLGQLYSLLTSILSTSLSIWLDLQNTWSLSIKYIQQRKTNQPLIFHFR